MAKRGEVGCGTILGIVVLLGILCVLARIIGVIMVLVSVAGVIYLLINKETFQAFSGLRKTGVILGLTSMFILGFALALPSDESPTNIPTPQITEEEVTTQNQDEQETKVTQASNSTAEPKAQDTVSSSLTLEKAVVISVTDGDTMKVRLDNGTEEKVRFIGVDTPESTTQHEPYGEEASAFTKSQLNGETVYLEKDVSERDKYGRLLRYIWLEPPSEESESSIRANLFNAILLLEGYAQVATYPPDVKYVDYFTKFQTEAREANKGLWGIAIEEETAATSSTSSDTTVYVTQTGSKYHRDGCRHLKSKIPISLEEAKASYEPCKVCNPPR